MRRKIIIGILSICAIISAAVGTWYWCNAKQNSISVESTSMDADPVKLKKVALPETKVVPTTDKVEANDGPDPIMVDAKGAVNLYKKQYPTAQIKGITFAEQDGRKSYEVAGVSSEAGHSVMIDATTGQVLSAEVDTAPENLKESTAIDLGNLINPDEAKQVAITILGSSARLIRWELETKEYVARYHMVLDVNGDIMHVVIDANSSQVIEVTKEG